LIDESGDRAGDGSHIDWVELYPDGRIAGTAATDE
jgi:hypothetical protein